MQIDGHHTATYVAARAAGFSHGDADKIAYAAQYVDDATNGGFIQFENSEYLYVRIASAHKMIDYNNFLDVQNHLAWLPFHFLPGNGGLQAGDSPAGGETAKLVCKPDSHVARDMLRAAFRDRGLPRELQRLGIAMHVYADTFAHQGFIGALNGANAARAVTSGDRGMDEAIRSLSEKEIWQKIRSRFRSFVQFLGKLVPVMYHEHKSPLEIYDDFFKVEPLGHAAVDTFPDQPYLEWQYRDWEGGEIRRDNPPVYVHAINMMTRAMRAWRAGDASMALENYPGLNPSDESRAETLFRCLREPRGEVRHNRWLAAIAAGEFSFGKQELAYNAKGRDSWKEAALGTIAASDSEYERFPYRPDFLVSDWKLFHDAVQVHRSDVVHGILPRYGICAA